MPAGAVDASTTRAKLEIVTEICSRIAAGESVSAIFRSPGDEYPKSMPTFWRWLHADPELERLYEAATERRGEKYAEEITEIADEPLPSKGQIAFVQYQKNRIDARKWVASRMRPKRWGDRVTLAGDADNPLRIDVESVRRKLVSQVADPDSPPASGDDDGSGT